MKKITFFLFGLIALVACEAELETEKANSLGDGNRMTRSGLTISPEEAAAQALEFRNDIMEQSGQTRGQKAEKGVTSVYAWRSSEIAPKSMTRSTASELLPDTLLYIVNFEDSCGYALVSADALIPGVMAFVEEGSLSPNQDINNPGFQNFLNGLGRFICDSIKAISDSLKYHTKDSTMFAKLDTTPQIADNLSYTLYRTIFSNGPLLKTEWAQYGPYNSECPLDSQGKRSVAGCVAIAIAQVAAYYRHPVSYNGHTYNWNAILRDSKVWPLDTIASHSVAQLINDIGGLVDMSYSSDVSLAYFDSIRHCLNVFGYHYLYNNTQWTDFSQIKEDISNGCPVIIRGNKNHQSNGHAWVIDGAVVKRHLFKQDKREYVHCNWGYGGECNGYFIYRAFNTMWDIETDQMRNDYYGYLAQYYGYNNNNYAYHQIYPNNQ